MASKKKSKVSKSKSSKGKTKPMAKKKPAAKKGGAAKGKKAPVAKKAKARGKAAAAKVKAPKKAPAKKVGASKKPAALKKVLAKPAPQAAARQPEDPAIELARRVASVLVERGAENVSIANVTAVTSFADCFVMASAASERQVHALSRGLSEAMKAEGHMPLSTEGEDQSHWILMDFGGVVAHLFYEPARQYYDLDGLWGDAPRVAFDASQAQRAAADARRRAQNHDAE